ncbi:Chemotaxis protein methyltransferase Cher2 [Jeotgalibaca dankookensis]|uniref:protein-glutamate O-methyltransferase n=1 Tax=Jeotgalibaca dankookensis TaxID=708126 RepID=A0A1S6IRJ0_9LACT|nr:protein-glutamate O-methyltransferase CheR [Jeotgalibaca dankookensis]AQS54175.1 Chemotaxis protein methyltransferase Cher2 [Jeotgalibaca dankookensis]
MTQQFEVFYNWSKRELNLQLDGYKQKQLQRRITTIMTKSGASNLADYAQKIKQDTQIKQDFLDYITINVTEFYRNELMFLEFTQLLVDKIAPQFSHLKIWSAACSTGAEAYSVAMALKKNHFHTRSTIIGTDLDLTVLKKAREGKYRDVEVKNVPTDELKKYFTHDDYHYYLNQEIKDLVSFKKHDLILDRYEKDCHAIICRNVTIYFNDEVKEAIYSSVSDALVPGGLFFIGATETIYNPQKYGFKKVGSFIYEKIE